jgi:hypothetical protein
MQAIMVSSRALIGLLAAASSLAVALSGTYLRAHTHTHLQRMCIHGLAAAPRRPEAWTEYDCFAS